MLKNIFFKRLFLCFMLCFITGTSATTQIAQFDSNSHTEQIITKLTSDEEIAVKSKIFKVAITEFPPFVFYDTNKIPKNQYFDGVSLEAFNLISKKIGIKFEYITYADLNEAIQAVKDNNADIVFNINSSNEDLIKTIPYFVKKAKIIVSRTKKLDWVDIINPESGKYLKMVDVRATKLNNYLKTPIINPIIIQVDTPIEALAKVAFGEADFVLMDSSQFGYYQKKLESTRLNVVEGGQTFDIVTSFGVSPKLDPNVLSALNSAIASFSVKENDYLESHWLAYNYEEPLIRPTFAILLFIIAFSTLNNVIWYRFYVSSHRVAEEINNRRWLAAATETIKNERAAVEAKTLKNDVYNL